MAYSQHKKLSAYQIALQHHKQGRLDEAGFFYSQALKSTPEDARIHHDLGVLYYQRSDYLHALECFDKAAVLDPCMAVAEFSKANVLVKIKRTEQALTAYRRAIEKHPHYFSALYNMARLYKDIGSYEEAEQHFRLALDLRPECCDTLNALGVVYLDLEAYDQAAACFGKAIGLDPGHVQSLYNLSLVLKRKGVADQAIPLVRRIVDQQPDFHEAVALLVSLLQQTCAWGELALAEAVLDKITHCELSNKIRTTETPFLSFTRKRNPQHNLQVSRAWGRHVQDVCPGTMPSIGRKARAGDSKITIGYLSEQFRDAATSHLMAALFEHHDRNRFTINAYSLGRDDGSMYRRKITQDVDNFIDIRGSTIRESAERIHADKVDILVDLSGWMRGHRIMILAMRPAPIQVNYLGYPGTSGADFIDYILADRIVIPPEHHPFFTEKVVYLPHCYQVTDPRPPVSDRGVTRAACGLPENAVVYCSFCTDYKIDRQIFLAWMEILEAVPGSVLWLLVRSEGTVANLRKVASEAGIAPERLIFAPALPKDQHLERLALADLALDTAIVNGHTTTTDALWAGVPVLTLQGSHFASRVASSLIRTMGLNLLVKATLKEYVDFAVHLGLDNRQLKLLKQSVRHNRFHSALFDIHGFTNGLEAAYLRMWEIHLRGEPPRSFAVSNC